MSNMDQLQISFGPYNEMETSSECDLDKIIFDLDSQIELLSSQADKLDYLVSIASGLLCGCLDVFWVGEFSLGRGRDIASDKVEGFVKWTAKKFGCKRDDLQSSAKFLEDMFPIPADGNTPDFGGGLQHHLRDFAHHFAPDIVKFRGTAWGFINAASDFVTHSMPHRNTQNYAENNWGRIMDGHTIMDKAVKLCMAR